MSCLKSLKVFLVALAALGILLPAGVLCADPVASGGGPQAVQPGVEIFDVALDARGSLLGLVVSVDGEPVGGATVTLHQGDRLIGQAVTDGLGRFALPAVRGGTYQVSTGRYATLVRTWAPGMAPPHARPLALLLVGGDVIRGQVPAADFFTSDTFVFVVLAGAIVAVPIAVKASEKSPTSP